MEGVLPIRGVDGSTGEAIHIDTTPSLREADDPFRVDVVRWAALDVPSIMVEEDLTKLREALRIPVVIKLIILGPNERACFPRKECTALHLNAFVSGMHLPLHPMLRRILRAYDLAPTQPRKLPKKKGREEEAWWFYLCPWGSHKPLVTGCPSSIKQWKESWFWVSGNWQRVFEDPEPDLDVPSVYGIANSLPRYELSRYIIDVLRSIYQGDPKTWSYELILNRHRCLVELGLMASKAEMDQGKRPRPTLAHLTKQRPKVLVLGSTEDTSQRKVIEDLSRKGNREAVGASTVIEVDDATDGEVPLSRKRKARAFETETSQARRNVVEVVDNYTASGGGDGGPYDSKRRFRELIGALGVRIPDDALQNLSFYPSMGAQAVKKYFTPKWEEFSSHGELEDVLEALEGLQAALDSARTAYEQMESDLKESESNVLDLTKQLDNANAVQKFTVEALEAANKEKRRLLEEAKSRDEEIQSLRKDLESSENGRKEAKAGRKEVEAKLANAEAEFMVNFHNTEAYTNFFDYFARVGQREVVTALRKDHPSFDLGPLEVRFPPPDVEGEEEN
ncbi:Uncharacterized protein Adt_17361 [Abeliophyllum distichum]|uniref:Uncharacterized protein n=1 Tax=Abeliophyllum distichum TaxID=126358 RepID=A0ABD1TGA3_9LAMI